MAPSVVVQPFAAREARTAAGSVLDVARLILLIIFALSLIVSTGPRYEVSAAWLPPPLAWKHVVASDFVFLALLALCLVTPRPLWDTLKRLAIPLAVLAATGMVVLIASPRPMAGLPTAARYAYGVAVLVVAASLPLKGHRLRAFAAAHSVATLLLCIVTVAAYLAYRTSGAGSQFLWLQTEPGWSLGSSVRAIATFAHPTTFVIFLQAALFYAALLIIQSRRLSWERILGWATVVAAVVVLPVTYSRAAFAIALTGFLVSLVSGSTRPAAVVRSTLMGCVAAATFVMATAVTYWAIFPIAVGRDAETQFLRVEVYTAKEERHLLYRTAFAMFAESPLTGIGPGLFGENMKRYIALAEYRAALHHYYTHPDGLVERWRNGADPHSAWFGLLAQGGLIGLAGMVTVLAAVFQRLRRATITTRPVAQMAGVFLVGFIALGCISEILTLKLYWLFLGVVLAVVDTGDMAGESP